MSMPNCFFRKLTDPVGLANIQLDDYYGRGMQITRIRVPEEHRRKGIAREMLKECCAAADQHNVILFLEIVPSGKMTWEDLERWYISFGFRHWHGTYIRKPVK